MQAQLHAKTCSKADDTPSQVLIIRQEMENCLEVLVM